MATEYHPRAYDLERTAFEVLESSGAEAFHQYLADLDAEIARGLGIPPDLVSGPASPNPQGREGGQ